MIRYAVWIFIALVVAGIGWQSTDNRILKPIIAVLGAAGAILVCYLGKH